jgi:hypothetical protein
MMIEIAVTETSTGRYYTLSTEKASMSISVGRWCVHVCSLNAAARLRRGLGGKVFHGPGALATAVRAYKSADCKAMIDAVIRAEQALAGAENAAIAA